MDQIPTQSDIELAHQSIQAYIHKTPLISSETFNNLVNAKLVFKSENLQKVGAFKYRGATNAILNLSEQEKRKGVATHSSGNHAQALALAAKTHNIQAHIVMPRTAPTVKKNAVIGYNANVYECEPTLQAREDKLNEVVAKTGATFIHPYNNYTIIAGQASCAKEIYEEFSPDYLLCPVGGGGLLSGTLLSTKFFSPKTKVIACEPDGANDTFRSFRDKKFYESINPDTIADGLLTSLGDKTYPIIMENIHNILTVSDEEIIIAMKLYWERTKNIIEPSSAVPIAVLLKHKELFKNKRVAIILSGGNVDLSKLPF